MTARFAVRCARLLWVAALLALMGAWLSTLRGAPLLGMSEQHLFADAGVLALLSLGMFADAWWHAREGN
jgi:hypothetical protein